MHFSSLKKNEDFREEPNLEGKLEQKAQKLEKVKITSFKSTAFLVESCTLAPPYYEMWMPSQIERVKTTLPL